MDDFTAEELERFRELIERANRELDERNELSQTTRDELDKFNSKLKSSTDDTTKTLNRLGNALTSYTAEVYKGGHTASTAASGVTSMTSALGGAVANLGPFGRAVSGATKALNVFITATAEQADAQYNALQGLQRFGGAANDGLEGVQRTLSGLNLTVSQLESMVQMLGRNAASLGVFRDTVAEAREELGEVGRVMKTEGITRNLMLLGMSAEEISGSMIDFVAMQSDVGMSQRRNTLELANASGNYLKEMNALTKATGLERDMLEEKIKAMREEERFRSFTARLRAEGRGDLALNAEILTSAMGGLFDETVAKGFRDILAGGGAISSDEARALANSLNMSQESVQQIARDFTSEQISMEEVLQRIGGGLGEFAERTRGLSRFVALSQSGNFISTATGENALIKAQQDFIEGLDRARAERAGEIEDPEGNVERQVDMIQALIDTNQNLEDLVQRIMPLNEIGASLADLTAFLTDVGADNFGAGTTGEGGAGGRADRPVAGRSGNDGQDGTPSATTRRGRNNPQPMGRSPIASDARTIADLVDKYSKHVGSGDSVTIEDLIPNSGIAAGVAKYIGTGLTQPLDLTPATIGKIIMGQKGLQLGQEPAAGERYRDNIRTLLSREFGEVGEFRQGGIATGPSSGYLAELHGTEAIVPLTGGSIPVTISNPEPPNSQAPMRDISSAISRLESGISGPIQQLVDNLNITEDLIQNTNTQQSEPAPTNTNNTENTRRMVEQTGVLRDQISRLDRLIQVSQSNNNIMSKILQNSTA